MTTPPPQPHALALPDTFTPDAIDTLTELGAVLSRLRAAANSAGGIGTGATPAPTPSAAAPSSAAGPLTLKDIPLATDGLKHKLQRAKAQLRALPDVARSAAEQRDEVAELEARVAAQREVLDRLRDLGLAFVKEEVGAGKDVKMET